MKYKTYKIVIEEEKTNAREVISMDALGIKNYDEFKNKYHEVVKNLTEKDEPCYVHFVGVKEDGSSEIRWTKNINVYDFTKEDYEMSTLEICEELERLICLLDKKKKYHSSILGAKDKDRSKNIHLIEFAKDDISDKEKIEQWELIRRLSKERRNEKNEMYSIRVADSQLRIGLLKKNITKATKELKKIDEIMKTDDYDEEANEVRKYTYKDNQEKDRLIKKLSKQWDRVIPVEYEKSIITYNISVQKKGKLEAKK